MRHVLFVLALVVGVVHASAQRKDAASGRGGTEQAIMRIEQEMLDALLKRDASANERYIADNAVFTLPDGEVVDKARLVADLKSADLKMETTSFSDMKVTVHGDTAIATYTTTDKGTYKGRDISGKYRWTDVFIRQKGNWKLVAGHGTPISRQ